MKVNIPLVVQTISFFYVIFSIKNLNVYRSNVAIILSSMCNFAYAVNPQAACSDDYLERWSQLYGVTSMAVESVAIMKPQVCMSCWGYKDGYRRAGATTCRPIIGPQPQPDCDKTGTAGNPIRLSDGAKYERVTDISTPTDSLLDWVRIYDSTNNGWRFLYEPFKQDDFGGQYKSDEYGWEFLAVRLPDNHKFVWTKNSYGTVQSFTTLSAYSAATTGNPFVIKGNYGKDYTYSNGQLQKVTRYDGKSLSLSYASGKLSSITDNSGKQLTFYYAGNALQFVEASWGPVVHYIYDGAHRLIKVGYGINRAQAPFGFSYTQYVYENANSPHALTGIIDAKGIRYATWRYDSQGRAIESYHADRKDYVSVDYSFDTIVTNSLGKRTTYRYTSLDVGRQVSEVKGEPSPHCAATNQYLTYYTNGEIQTRTDKRGMVTLYDRNTDGRITKETKGLRWSGSIQSGYAVNLNLLIPPTNLTELQVTETCWHSSLPLPVRKIEATSVTTFEYTPTGKLLKETTKARPTNGSITCNSAL